MLQMFGSNASACQMNSDGVFITRLHTALHTHAVSQNQQTAFSPNLPLPSTEIDLAPRSDCSGGWGGEPALWKSSGAAFLTSAAETYHLVHGHEAGIQGDDSEENLEGGGGENTNWFVRNMTATMTWWTLYRALGQTIIHQKLLQCQSGIEDIFFLRVKRIFLSGFVTVTRNYTQFLQRIILKR